jgi:hypothetical protein
MILAMLRFGDKSLEEPDHLPNPTEYAFTINMELGVLVTGGSLPGQVQEHFDLLIGSCVFAQA